MNQKKEQAIEDKIREITDRWLSWTQVPDGCNEELAKLFDDKIEPLRKEIKQLKGEIQRHKDSKWCHEDE